MTPYKNIIITCQYCGRKIMVKPTDQANGTILCSHTGCGKINQLVSRFYYNESVVQRIPEVGRLTLSVDSRVSYPLQFGENSIGTSETCTIRIERYLHNGRCFISRRHCTLTVTFDKWQGTFRYQLQDGAAEPGSTIIRNSLNGTFINQTKLQPTEIIDVPDGSLITLGGIDAFTLIHQPITTSLLELYKISAVSNPDSTQ